MARLTGLHALLLLGAGAVPDEAAAADAVAAPNAVERWRPLAREAASRFAVPEELVLGVIRTESGGRTMLEGRPTTSPEGAMGLMQLMPATWAAMRARLGLGHDPHDPRDNILAGTAFLRLLRDRFGEAGMLAAYSAGPGRYAEHLASGRPLPAETTAYLAKLAGVAPQGRGAAPAAREAPIFVARGVDPAAAGAPGVAPAPAGRSTTPRSSAARSAAAQTSAAGSPRDLFVALSSR